MAKAGLSFESPLYTATGGDLASAMSPYTFLNPAASPGQDALQKGLTDIAAMGANAMRQTQFTMPEMKKPPTIAYSPGRKELFVNGMTFAEDDATKTLQAEQLIGQPGVGLPQGGDWIPLTPQSYGQLTNSIRNPGFSRLAAKNFGIGVDQLQMLAGRGLQFLGAEETGANIVAQQEADLAKTLPYQREFSDVKDASTAVDWLVATVAQQGPNILESIGTAAAGFFAGTAAGGPAAGAGAALAGLAGKTAFKQSVMAAIKKKAAGEALDAAENKLLREAAGIAGATIASTAQNYATGVADIYGEQREQGMGAEGGRLASLAGAVPYAALESLPEFLLASRLFGTGGLAGAGGKALRDIQGTNVATTGLKRGAELLRRGVVGGVAGGLAEGTTELGQELLTTGISGQDWADPDVQKRLLESFAAGFGVGGVLGGAANLRKGPITKKPTDLLNPAANPEPTSTAMTVYKGPLEGEVLPPENKPLPQLPGGGGQALALPMGEPQPGIIVQGQGELPSGPGTQGVLPIFGDEAVPVEELRQRMQPPLVQTTGTTTVTPQQPAVSPAQGSLQFAGEAPVAPTGPVNPIMQQRMQAALAAQQRARDFEAQQAQQEQLKQQQLDQLQRQGQIQRQLDIMQQGQQQPAPAPMPMVQGRPRQPQQLELFNRRQAPRPSRAEGLRRGAAPMQLPTGPTMTAPIDLRKAKQIPLFTQEGKPSLAALKAAGKKQPVAAPTVEAGAVQAPPTGKPVTAVTAGKAKQAALKKEQEKAAKTKAGVAKLKKAVGEERRTEYPVVVDGQPATLIISRNVSGEVRAGNTEVTDARIKFSDKTILALGKQGYLSDEKLIQNLRDTEIIDTQPTEPTPPKGKAKLAKEKPNAAAQGKKPEGGKQERKQDRTRVGARGDVGQDQTTQDQTGGDQAGRGRESGTGRTQQTQGEAVTPMTPIEAWEDMKPEMAVEFDRLPKATQKQWTDAVAAGTASMDTAQKLYDNADVELTTVEVLREEIAAADAAASIRDFKDAIDTVVFYAFFDVSENNVRNGVRNMARNYLSQTQFTEAQRKAIDDMIVQTVNTMPSMEATYKADSKKGLWKKGDMRPWFNYMVMRNLISQIKNLEERVTGLPEQYKTPKEPKQKKVETSDKQVQKPWTELEAMIDDLLTGVRFVLNQTKAAQLAKTMEELYAAAKAAGKADYLTTRANKLSDYFTADGKLKPMLKTLEGNFVPTTQVLTKEQMAAREKEAKANRAAMEAERRQKEEEERTRDENYRRAMSGESVSDWDGDVGMEYNRDDGEKIASTIPLGRVQLLVRGFLSRFKVKPNVSVFRNMDEFKTKNPSLFAKAAAAYKQGDFAARNPAGYAFGNNIIIFSDRIRTERQLGFILAHEALGHFGFRAVMSAGELNTMLNTIYNSDARVRSMVDRMMEMYGMSKSEAIEEFIADNAAILDTSMIARIWNFLKNALNKLGMKFDDDNARMLINQARKYLRTGEGSFISARTVAENMVRMEQEAEGRFFDMALDDEILSTKYMASAGLNKQSGIFGGLSGGVNFFNDPKVQRFINSNFGGFKTMLGKIAEKVQTLDNMATRSEGLSKVFHILQAQSNKARALLSQFNRLATFTHQVRGGPSDEDIQLANRLLEQAALYKGSEFTEELLRRTPEILQIDEMGNVTINQAALLEVQKLGFVTADEFRKGISFTDSQGNKQTFDPIDIDENSAAWKVYKEQRDVVNEVAIEVMMSNFEAARYEQDAVIDRISRLKGKGGVGFSSDDLQAIKKIAKMYRDLAYAGVDVQNASMSLKKEAQDNANEFLVEVTRAIFNDQKLNDWLTGNPKEAASKFQGDEFKDIIASLKSLNAKGLTDKQVISTIQRGISDLLMFSTQTRDAEYYAKRTILGSYVPLRRRGNLQVKVVAYDERGNIIKLAPEHAGVMPYYQVDGQAEADNIVSELDALFEGKEYTLLNAEGQEVKVTFKAERSELSKSPDLSDVMNYNEFVYILNRMNINITPQERQTIVQTLTAQNARARANLQREGNPGWNPDIIRNVAEYAETGAYVAAKKIYRHRLDDVFNRRGLWIGDDQKLAALKAAVDAAKTPGAKAQAQREYDKYAYMYRYMKGSGHTVEIGGKKFDTLGRGDRYLEEAKKLIRWQNEQINIVDSTEDMLTEFGSPLKMWAVIMQLGGSVASAVLNLISIATHSWSYLTYYNQDRGYGLGFGGAKAARALFQASSDLKNPKLADAKELWDMLQSGDYEKLGLTEDEAQFLFDQTEKGTLQAAQFNALLGTARGNIRSSKAAGAIQAWMYMFSYTEQFNRRVTALAAYRLEKERSMAEGKSEEDARYAAAQIGQQAVNTSQGEYAMYNRPEMARGNLLQYVFMYKQFVIISVQLMKGLPPAGRVTFLAMLFLMSGLKGLPFADDLLDIIDTLMQKFGIKKGSVEGELYKFFDGLIPGSAPLFMRGILDPATGATISTRVGLGDLIPLTGVFRAGADPWREVQNFAGPVASGIMGIAGMGSAIASYGAEAVGLKKDVTTINDILRESPITAFRALGDTYSYWNNGAITSPQGKMVSTNVDAATYITRLLGFYPSTATTQNDLVRVAKISRDYMLDVRASYTAAYVKAGMSGDREAQQNILQSVAEWNDAAQGTGLELRRFPATANRALREAQRPTAERFRRSAPLGVRQETAELMAVMGLTPEVIREMAQPQQ